MTLALALENAKSAADILALKERKQIHLRDMFAERDIYKKISEKAANDPKLLTSLVFDHANGIRVPMLPSSRSLPIPWFVPASKYGE